MATITSAVILNPTIAAMGTVKVVIGRLNGNYAGNPPVGGDILPAAALGMEQIDDVHFANPGLKAGGANSVVKYVRDANGINGKVAFHLLTTGAEATLAAQRPDDIRFVAFGR